MANDQQHAERQFILQRLADASSQLQEMIVALRRFRSVDVEKLVLFRRRVAVLTDKFRDAADINAPELINETLNAFRDFADLTRRAMESLKKLSRKK